MTQRTFALAAVALATMLPACSQGQSSPPPAPEAPVYGTTTGELACDEYLALAKACADKGRLPVLSGRRADLASVERAIRGLAAGRGFELDRADVWGSAVHAAHVQRRLEAVVARAKDDFKQPEPVRSEIPAAEVCKRGIDQLPMNCQ